MEHHFETGSVGIQPQREAISNFTSLSDSNYLLFLFPLLTRFHLSLFWDILRAINYAWPIGLRFLKGFRRICLPSVRWVKYKKKENFVVLLWCKKVDKFCEKFHLQPYLKVFTALSSSLYLSFTFPSDCADGVVFFYSFAPNVCLFCFKSLTTYIHNIKERHKKWLWNDQRLKWKFYPLKKL